MKKLTLASCAVLLFLMPALAFAQRTPPAGSTSAGTAAPRGGESTSSSSGSSGSASERGGSSMNSGGSSSGSSSASPVNMSSGSYNGPRSGEASASGVARARSASASIGQPVPASERPRGDRPTLGQAVPRGSAKPPQNNGAGYPYVDYGNYGYYPFLGGWYGGYYGYYGSPYGVSPYSWNPYGYDPNMWWTSVGPLYGWGMYALPMSGYSSLWYDYYAAESPSYVQSINGSIKLKVKPKDAEVYVDGTYYGRVDHYDGAFQHLDLRAGTHRVEIRANGYQPIEFQVRVLPGRSITYNGEMKPVVVK